MFDKMYHPLIRYYAGTPRASSVPRCWFAILAVLEVAQNPFPTHHEVQSTNSPLGFCECCAPPRGQLPQKRSQFWLTIMASTLAATVAVLRGRKKFGLVALDLSEHGLTQRHLFPSGCNRGSEEQVGLTGRHESRVSTINFSVDHTPKK